jgi:hypothetical protein
MAHKVTPTRQRMFVRSDSDQLSAVSFQLRAKAGR